MLPYDKKDVVELFSVDVTEVEKFCRYYISKCFGQFGEVVLGVKIGRMEEILKLK